MKPSRFEPLRSPVALACFLGVAAVGLTIDLWTKALAVEHLKPGRRVVQFIPYLVRFEYTENHGAVFGMGQGQKTLFIAVSIIAISFLVYLFLTSARARLYQVVLGMLLAGVIGNMYDRLTYGYVRDMIHGLPEVHWPRWAVDLMPRAWHPAPGQQMEVFPWIFNVADSLLCVGVFAMIVYSFILERQRARMLDASQRSDDGDGDRAARAEAPS